MNTNNGSRTNLQLKEKETHSSIKYQQFRRRHLTVSSFWKRTYCCSVKPVQFFQYPGKSSNWYVQMEISTSMVQATTSHQKIFSRRLHRGQYTWKIGKYITHYKRFLELTLNMSYIPLQRIQNIIVTTQIPSNTKKNMA